MPLFAPDFWAIKPGGSALPGLAYALAMSLAPEWEEDLEFETPLAP